MTVALAEGNTCSDDSIMAVALAVKAAAIVVDVALAIAVRVLAEASEQ